LFKIVSIGASPSLYLSVKYCDMQLEAMRATVQRSTEELARKAKYDTATAPTTVTTTPPQVAYISVCSVALREVLWVLQHRTAVFLGHRKWNRMRCVQQ